MIENSMKALKVIAFAGLLKLGLAVLPVFGLGVWGQAALAQTIVNIESVRLRAMDQLGPDKGYGFAGRLDFQLDSTSGNVQQFAAELSNSLLWLRPESYNIFIVNGRYGESFSVKNANRLFAHLRHVQNITPVLFWEMFTQAQSDEFKRLRLRALAGGGLRRQLWASRSLRGLNAYGGIGVFYALEELKATSGSPDYREELVRINSYLSLVQSLPKSQGSLSTTLYFQPQVDRFEDFHIFWEAAMTFQLTESLAAKLSVDVVHDNLPPEEVKKTDSRYRVGWTWSY